MHDIDVHIIVTDGWTGQKEHWLDQCLSSLEDEPVNIHLIEGELGHIGRSRARGFRQGDAKYVSFVDPDDWVEPGIFSLVQQHLDQHPEVSLAATAERIHDEMVTDNLDLIYEQEVSFDNIGQVHHLVVARREEISKYLHVTEQFECRCEPATWLSMYVGGCVMHMIREIGYNWRIHPGGSHKAFDPSKPTSEHLQRLLDQANRYWSV